jgi:DNA polymerase-1
MIEMAILFPDFPRGLDFITTMYTDLQYYKDDGKKYFKIGGDERDFWTYNAKDSLVCSEAYPKLQAELVRQGNLSAYQRQAKMISPCVYMQERGMRMDVAGMKIASDDAEKRLSTYQEELNQLAGTELNPNSPKQLIEYFYIKKRIKPYIGKEGNMTTDEDAMRRLARQGIKEAQIIRDMRRWRKLKGTYLDVKLSADGRLRSAMNPGKTKTGRLASGEDIFGEGTNVQNIPEGVRQYMLIDEGYVCYVCDLSQAENRIVANIAPEPIMLDIFDKGKDMHSITGAYVSGLKAELVKQQDNEGIKSPLGSGEYTWRFWGKKLNHSLNYDLGYKTFALRFDLIEAEAKPLVEGWHQLYAGIRQYHAWIQAQLQATSTLTNLFGRKRLFLNRPDDKRNKEAYAQIPQSTVADKIDEQGVEYLYYEEPELFRPVDLLNQIHDSVIFQLPLSIPWQHHAEILLALKKSLESPLDWHGNSFIIPLDIKMHIHNLSKKDGKEVKIDGSDTGRLAAQLSEIYGQYGSTQQVSSVEWNISDISVLEEEGSDALGDGYSLS